MSKYPECIQSRQAQVFFTMLALCIFFLCLFSPVASFAFDASADNTALIESSSENAPLLLAMVAPLKTATGTTVSLSTSAISFKQGEVIAVWVDNAPKNTDLRIKASWLKNPVRTRVWNGRAIAFIQIPISISPNTYSVRAVKIPVNAIGKALPAVEITGTKVLVKIKAKKFEKQIFSVSKELEAKRSAENLNDDAKNVVKAKANPSSLPLWST